MPESAVRKVTVIPADPKHNQKDIRKQRLRVAPYCRVSTSSEEQLDSYQAQIEYYTEKIAAQQEWTMVDMFADEGKTATSTKKRKDFLRMIKACEKGKVDLIITKSVSRFCRNTLDGLDYVRRLKRMGVGVFFEKENVNTLYMDNEMILTFMMSQAQAESESMSGNIRWGHRKNFKDGKVYFHYAGFLGYRRGENNLPEIDPGEAEIVRRIFSRYLIGHSVAKIIADLEADGIKTARGHKKWNDGVIRGMLRNEKYMGDALLQKTYIADLFTRQTKKNTGELPQYYVENSHPAIIDRLTFQRVQEEMARRSSLKKVSAAAKTELAKYSGKYVLTELLSCGNCGSPYRRVTWTRPEGKKIVWRCINRLENGKKFCKDAPTLEESRIHTAVVSAMNEMFSLKSMKAILQDSIRTTLTPKGGETSLAAIDSRLSQLREQQYRLLQLAAAVGADSTQYDEELKKVSMEFSALVAKRSELEKNKQDTEQADERVEQLAAELESMDTGIATFDEVTVRQLISAITVLSEEKLLIRFKDGTEIEQII
ncbi:recombinase family protein [Lacrimispora amygdalina]|jgi:DNA invertase Pin-like site-specific DNA recombinase|uniref:Recombinase family protein n=2 Tax=Lacrimispora TaxID=2719231 RepID=A0ABX1VWC4_9FIRM|nr:MULTISPECIES: recombinase family protein [Clostridia]NNJ31127.1 recombinase family protein [Lacrimispora defluvii]RFZ77669.1 recombinase family protein [Clostridium indicum]